MPPKTHLRASTDIRARALSSPGEPSPQPVNQTSRQDSRDREKTRALAARPSSRHRAVVRSMLIENSSARRRPPPGKLGRDDGARRNARYGGVAAAGGGGGVRAGVSIHTLRHTGARRVVVVCTASNYAAGSQRPAGYNMPDGSWGGRLCKQQRALMGERMPERTRERNATTHKKLVVGLLAQVGKRRLSMQCPFQSGHCIWLCAVPIPELCGLVFSRRGALHIN